jgi:hypothetical protein
VARLLRCSLWVHARRRPGFLDLDSLGSPIITKKIIGKVTFTDISNISSARISLTPTGAFDAGEAGEPFRSISGVLWFRLYKVGNLFRSYKLYQNPSATYPIPDACCRHPRASHE